jgi:hypothetical protein
MTTIDLLNDNVQANLLFPNIEDCNVCKSPQFANQNKTTITKNASGAVTS